MVQVARGHRLYISFSDKDGNDLLSQSNLVLDTAYVGTAKTPYYTLNENEYSLRLIVDGKENMEPDLISYNFYKKDSYDNLSFSCGEYDLRLTQKRDYIYSSV